MAPSDHLPSSILQPQAGATLDVAAGLVFRDQRLLVAQRPPGGHLAGFWEFPGGKREADESWEACLLRELREELAIDVRFSRWFYEVFHPYPDRTVHLRFGVCHWHAQEPRALGCSAFAWVTPAELSRYQFPPADTVLLERLIDLEEFYPNSF